MIENIPEWLNKGKPEKNSAASQLESSRTEMYKALELYYTHVKYVITILFSLVAALFAILGLYEKLPANLLPTSTIKFLIGYTLSIFVPLFTALAIFIIKRYYEVYVSSLIFALRVHLAVDMAHTHPWFVRTIEQAKKWQEKVHSDNDFLSKRSRSLRDTFMLYSGIIVLLAILSCVYGLKVLSVFEGTFCR